MTIRKIGVKFSNSLNSKITIIASVISVIVVAGCIGLLSMKFAGHFDLTDKKEGWQSLPEQKSDGYAVEADQGNKGGIFDNGKDVQDDNNLSTSEVSVRSQSVTASLSDKNSSYSKGETIAKHSEATSESPQIGTEDDSNIGGGTRPDYQVLANAYPKKNNCPADNSLYTYFNGSVCSDSSYVSWKIYDNHGIDITNWGDISEWQEKAVANGYTVNTIPAADSIAIITTSVISHAAVVESINTDGTINISEYTTDKSTITGLANDYDYHVHLCSDNIIFIHFEYEPVYDGSNKYAYGWDTWYAWERRQDLPSNLGSANNWGSRAAAAGFIVNHTPTPGAVFQRSGGLGHVGIVEEVFLDGSVRVSDMNGYASWGHVGHATWSAETAAGYMYIHQK